MSVPGIPKTDPLFKYGRSEGAPFTREAFLVGIGPQGSVADPGVCAFADFAPDAMSTAETMAPMMNRATA